MIQADFTPDEHANGRKELAAALDHFGRQGLTGEPPAGTPPGDTRHFCAPANLEALLVTQCGGGWVATVVFRSMPEDQPNAIRTSANDPYPSYREAMLAGREILRTLLAIAQASFYLDGEPYLAL